jgi:MerR family transcriptional regulator/heat shock protein HspR
MKVAVRRPDGRLPNGTTKIGAVAKMFDVSVDLLRLYEREHLLIPVKSTRGTRYFTVHDFLWIETILRLVREARLNFAGIRRLLALLPCWEVRKCGYSRREGCPYMKDASRPCWASRKCCTATQPTVVIPEMPILEGNATGNAEPREDCYFCPVYRSAPACENLKVLLAASPENQKTAAPFTFE